ncbi:hypothetical protein [Iamia sp.]|uniref:nucleotide-binding protein n=1 Tax=Iamia sp. TaxID=2722710 RepID=UPI002C0D7E35|nr:hypothetical protein [Iamia sp.]HXH58899.1 hypothetical protein [Iamia sp.]
MMRVAFVGKGGVGKSAIAGTFARIVARRGDPVLAVDSDPLPGLALSLGLAATGGPALDGAVEERPEGEEGPRFRLRPGLTAAAAVEQYAELAPDGVRFLQFGGARPGGDMFRSQQAFRQIIDGLSPDRWNLVGDLPGGTRQPFFGWASYARTILIVVEPTAKSVLSGRRLARLATAEDAPELFVLVNKARRDGDGIDVAERVGLPLAGVVPWDEELAAAERQGSAPIDVAPDCRAVRAVGSLAETAVGRGTP